MKRFLSITLVILIAVPAYIGYGIYQRSGAGLTLENTSPGECRKITVAPGAEDIQYDADTGLAFITADNRFIPHTPLNYDQEPALAGNGIYVVDFSTGTPSAARRVSPEGLPGFRPHGLYLWKGNGETRLFVVNHKTSSEKVEEVIDIFNVGNDGTLTHLEGISFPAMSNPNDVIAVGPRQFYATNFLHHHGGNALMYEVLMAPPYSYVVYFDGSQGDVVVDGLSAANGLGISPDQQTLYAMEWNQRRIAVLERQTDNTLRQSDRIKLPTLADNVNVDSDGNLWIAGQPKLFEAIAFRQGKRTTSSSLAAKVDARSKHVETLFISIDGGLNNASSAEIADDKLLIGSVNDDFITVCDLPNQ